MLIDTRQLVSLTKLRGAVGEYVSQVKSGAVFYVTEKGRIQAMISPVRTQDNTQCDFFTTIDSLREKSAKIEFADKRDSTQIIRKMRDSRYGS